MISIKFILKNTPLADGSFRVLIRLIKDQKKKVISLGLKCSEKEFEHGRFNRRHKAFKKRNELLKSYEDRINDIVDEFELKGAKYTLNDIEKAFKSKKADVPTMFQLFDQKIKSPLIKPKTAKAYRDTKNSLERFHPGELHVKNIDTMFLEHYSAHLRNRGSNDGGIRFFMTHLKAIWNTAEKADIVSNKNSPFKHFKLSRFRGKPSKKGIKKR